MSFDDWYDDEDADDQDEADDDLTAPCPYCRRPVFDDAEQCPSCGKYLSREDVPYRHGHPGWLLFGTGVCLLIVAFWFWRSTFGLLRE